MDLSHHYRILGFLELCLIEERIFLIPTLREREISRPVAFQAFFFDTNRRHCSLP
jgi:hypothetical protein